MDFLPFELMRECGWWSLILPLELYAGMCVSICMLGYAFEPRVLYFLVCYFMLLKFKTRRSVHATFSLNMGHTYELRLRAAYCVFLVVSVFTPYSCKHSGCACGERGERPSEIN